MSGHNNAQEWFSKADEDEKSILAILHHREGSSSTVCFLAQQMTEKYLKGLLIFNHVAPLKVHDLLQLETILLGVDGRISAIHHELIVLNRYYIETRYPGDYPEFSWKEAREAYQSAKRVKEFVLKNQ